MSRHKTILDDWIYNPNKVLAQHYTIVVILSHHVITSLGAFASRSSSVSNLSTVYRQLLFVFFTTLLFVPITGHNCSKNEFSCTSGAQCISNVQWQDGIDDCWDGSDECKWLYPITFSK
uniref:LNR domain-containing protein n=1 Tax=Heterorhabditis bacteriophora TaxID=37862 RepID=A0A1I7XAL6_HETBA